MDTYVVFTCDGKPVEFNFQKKGKSIVWPKEIPFPQPNDTIMSGPSRYQITSRLYRIEATYIEITYRLNKY